MRRRRKIKGGRSFYMVLSIFCLTALFLGYSFVYNLSEERKSDKEVTTISIDYKSDRDDKDKDNILEKIMSYFNIFLKKTFQDKRDAEEVFEIIDTQGKDYDIFTTIASRDIRDNLEIFNENDYTMESSKDVYLSNDRIKNFFKVISTTSRSSTPRKLFLKDDSNLDNLNIVLFHTHGTEAFQSTYSTNYRSLEENLNILGIGSRISESLENIGINNIHLKDYNDYPDYNSSYANSNNAVRPVLSDSKKNILIDFHRDGAEENSSYEAHLSEVKTIEIDGKTAATCTLVVGNKNNNADKLKENATVLFEVAYQLYPGLLRDIIIRDGAYFNQYLSDYSFLVEVGCTLNTLEEIQYTADLLTEVLYEYFNGIDK